jgi:hypothetical protein
MLGMFCIIMVRSGQSTVARSTGDRIPALVAVGLSSRHCQTLGPVVVHARSGARSQETYVYGVI